MKPTIGQPYTFTKSGPAPVDVWADVKAEMAKKNAPQTKKKQTGRGGFLSSLISEGGGLGGAVAGGAAGSAILPGVGTAIGAGLGGLVGAFGGRLTENKIRDDEFRPGQALTEGLVTGALSAAGPAFQAFKGAKAGKGLSSAIGGVDDVAKATKALPSTATIGAVEKKGLGMTSKSGGYFVGATRPGAKPLSPSQVQAYDKLLRKLKVPANDASDMLYVIEPTLNKIYGLLDDAVKGSAATIDGKKLAKNVLDDIVSKKGLGQTELKIAREQAAKFKSKMSPQEALKAKREFDEAISYVANPDAATSSKQAVSEMFRRALKKEIDNAVPGIKGVNSTAHDLSEVMSFASRAANRTGMEATSGAGGIAGRVLSSPLANTMRAKAGVATQAVGRGLAGTGSPITQATRYAKLQAPGNILGALGGSQETTPDLAGPTTDAMTETASLTPDIMNPGQTTGMEPQMPQYTLQQALAEAYQIAPNASESELLSYAKALQAERETTSPTGNGLNVTKPTSEKYSQALGGAQALNQLEQIIAQGGVPKGSRAPGRGIEFMGIGSDIRRATGTGEFDTVAFNTVDNLLRILTGAQAPESEIRRYMNQYIPKAGDTPQTVQTKLDLMRQQFNSILELAGNEQTQESNPLYDAMLNSGGAY